MNLLGKSTIDSLLRFDIIIFFDSCVSLSISLKVTTMTGSFVIKNVSIFSSGLFKCKVATNKKEIKETAARIMLVIETPKNVELEIPKDIYEIGEMLEAKCISYSSNPVAFISWNINDKDISPPQRPRLGELFCPPLNAFFKPHHCEKIETI